jgi:hypothetical protein
MAAVLEMADDRSLQRGLLAQFTEERRWRCVGVRESPVEDLLDRCLVGTDAVVVDRAGS